jgi:ABC-2 type transport system ATP-binding protein
LIYHGTIIAMGTSVEMKTRFMKNDVLEIVVDAAKDWIDGLDALEMVKEAALFGANIHAVVYEAARAIPALKAYLASKGANVREIRKIVPSLEDVFVSAIENYDKEHAS